jgi:hypothetical protein
MQEAAMRTQSSDTNPVVEQMQIAGLRRLSPWQRFELANQLTRSVFALSWQNFRRRHADLDDDAAALHWVRLLYGDDLAARVAAYMEQRRSA